MYSREKYLANRDEVKARSREYYRQNREKVLDRLKLQDPAVRSARNREQYAKHREKRLQYAKDTYSADVRRAKRYGLTKEQFDAMLAAQNGMCGVCSEKPDRILVDHDHVTGRVRGLLCHSCNVTLGLMKDSPERLEQAANYLRKSPWQT